MIHVMIEIVKKEDCILGRNKLNLKQVGMIFDLDENSTNYSLDPLASFGDNVKLASHRSGCLLTSEFK
jgi:hypothetical protein